MQQASADREAIANLLSGTEPARWIFAGDSITHGALHTFGARDYTELFSERLRYELGRVRDCVIKTGVGGWRIRILRDDLDWSLLQHRPHVVSLHFGMNDCTDEAAGLAGFREDYEAVIDRVRSDFDAAVIVHTPNPVLPDDPVRFEWLPAYVGIAREIAQSTGAILIDHFARWQDEYLFHWLADAIHPNDIGHRAMAHELLRELNLWDRASPVCRLFVSDHAKRLGNQ